MLMSFWVCFIFVSVAPKDISACHSVFKNPEIWQQLWQKKTFKNTSKNNEKNLENLEIVKKKIGRHPASGNQA